MRIQLIWKLMLRGNLTASICMLLFTLLENNYKLSCRNWCVIFIVDARPVNDKFLYSCKSTLICQRNGRYDGYMHLKKDFIDTQEYYTHRLNGKHQNDFIDTQEYYTHRLNGKHQNVWAECTRTANIFEFVFWNII